MRIFLCYASEQRPIAALICDALRQEGHEVFFDRDNLGTGEAFHSEIRRRIHRSQVFVVLLSPESARHGAYARTEIEIARRRWPQSGGRVLPVRVANVDVDDWPSYLRTMTVLEPDGPVEAAVVGEVEDRRAARRRRFWSYVGAVLALFVMVISVATVVSKAAAPELNVIEQDALVWEIGGKKQAVYLLSSGALWANSGIAVPPGYKAEIRASGQVSLAVHHVVRDAESDDTPTHRWLGPEGGGLRPDASVRDVERQKLMICTSSDEGCAESQGRGPLWGALVGVALPKGEVPSAEMPRPAGRKVLGRFGVIDNCDRTDRILWFVVNDSVLSEDQARAYTGPELYDDFHGRIAYLESEEENQVEGAADAGSGNSGARLSHGSCAGLVSRQDEFDCLFRRWRSIRDQSRWGLWYEDNIGQYLIGVEITETDCSRSERFAR